MFSAPTSVQHLEDRIATNVTFFKGGNFFVVEARGFSHVGFGRSPDAAVRNFLQRNHLDGEDR
jgi:hypothetical protein